MSRPSISWKDVCGGRYGVSPAAPGVDPDLGNGPHRLYTIMCSHARPDGICKISLKRQASKLRVSVRTIQAWKRSLEEQGWLEELHEGDKAVGIFRVTRNPSKCKEVQIRNAPKIIDRAARKTPHAKRYSHTRCESDLAQNKSHQDPLVFPQEQNAVPSGTDRGVGTARQRNRWRALSVTPTAPSGSAMTFNNKNQNRSPDLAGWVGWLVSSRRVPDEESAWRWLMTEPDRIAEEHSVSKEEAKRMLDQQLKIQRRAEQ